jgi:hypothetical protein
MRYFTEDEMRRIIGASNGLAVSVDRLGSVFSRLSSTQARKLLSKVSAWLTWITSPDRELLGNLEVSNESWRAKTRRSEDLTVPRSHRGDMYLWNLSQQSTTA